MSPDTPRADAASGAGRAAVLHLALAQTLPVGELTRILQALHDLYFAHQWLRLTERAEPGRGPPEAYQPAEDEGLYVERMEVGTPNFVELVGLAVDMWPTFAAVATSFGAAVKLSASAFKDYAEARKAVTERRKIILDMNSLEMDLARKAQALHGQGKLTEAQVAHKAELQRGALSILQRELREYAGEPQLKLVEQPLSVWLGATPAPETESPAAAAPRPPAPPAPPAGAPAAAGPAVEEQALAALLAYRSARETLQRRPGAESRQALQRAYAELVTALSELSEDEISGLLDSLGGDP